MYTYPDGTDVPETASSRASASASASGGTNSGGDWGHNQHQQKKKKGGSVSGGSAASISGASSSRENNSNNNNNNKVISPSSASAVDNSGKDENEAQVFVREKVRVESADPALMSLGTKLSALAKTLSLARGNLAVVMGEDPEW